LLKTLEYPNTYTYSATFLTTVGVYLLVKEYISLLIRSSILIED
jgi:hypothetical protein